jgi:diadenosine tetraphosphate (Ap4A) HIT family hydrolase
MAFEMDARLAADTLPVATLDLCQLRLMNDARWPWLILVPTLEAASEIHLLSVEEQALLAYETGACAQTLQKVTGCLKINSGALGNVVRQLHVHVIARNEGDANWPGPVWGFGTRLPYHNDQAAAFIENFRRAYPATLS